ncbi:MAG: carboxypeptidase-like regulatory domain-containing protein [Acidobacteriota bacterium]
MKVLTLIFLFEALLPAKFFSQQVTGTVSDIEGASISNVSVVFTAVDKNIYSVQTNSDGHFQVMLTPGVYSIDFSVRGFVTTRMTNFHVGRRKMTLDIFLDADMDGVEAIYSEFICDKSGKCDYVSRLGTGSTKPTVIDTRTIKNRKIKERINEHINIRNY